MTVNPCVKTDHYPLPTVEDMFAVLAGGKVFTVSDLSAYQQIELHPDLRPLLTINTHMGLFQYVRMPYGISSAPTVFQAIMDELLKGLSGVVRYLDDVLITGADYNECLARVEAVLQRFEKHGVKVRHEKCKFFVKSVRYLGQIIDETGVHPCLEKVEANAEKLHGTKGLSWHVDILFPVHAEHVTGTKRCYTNFFKKRNLGHGRRRLKRHFRKARKCSLRIQY